MADTTIDLLKNSSYVGKMDELIAAVKSGGGTASDVEWDNVKNKPTTIVGYGITDAKIENGTITLGNQTISIPDKLPNPNALTFTGAVTETYDGSAPVTVNIPSSGEGGSGSGALPNWRLIKTISISSEIVSYDFNTDDNGDSFALKEIMLAGTVPAYSGYIYIKLKNTGVQNSIWPTAAKDLRWWAASVSGKLKTMLAVSNASVIWPVDKDPVCDNDTISRLLIGASGGFTADGTMYVYGR